MVGVGVGVEDAIYAGKVFTDALLPKFGRCIDDVMYRMRYVGRVIGDEDGWSATLIAWVG